MQFFIGITPPQSDLDRIVQFQKRWYEARTEPHITVKAQGGLTEDLEWLPKVVDVCLRTFPFEIELAATRFFAKEVLFLSVHSRQIEAFHRALVHAVAPPAELIKPYYELEDYSPHLTLGQTKHGLTYDELTAMKNASEATLSPYPKFQADSVKIYKQDHDKQGYKAYLTVPLGAGE